ncbi:ribonuclease E/G [Parablautia muri]|uniref:Ribonuclease E/G n=1 Tax=Parablautia muri TaxID=2320879 RepID=A0A9X5GQU7_9FIRM|nr:ribonuclease E/G [Parablautia muri]NBJ91466.1 ribonuclease E/G [Parablautia muri]
MGKIIITKKNNRLLLTLFDEKKPYLIEMAPSLEMESVLGNIYIAKVKDIVPGIHGAFLAISANKNVFLPLKERCGEILCVNKELTQESPLRQGDEIVVQIVGDALKSKHPTASGNLALTGQYCVCEFFGHGISYSQKLNEKKKKNIAEKIQTAEIEGRRQYHFIIRTNVENLENYEPLFHEMKNFIRVFNDMIGIYKHRTVYTCLYHRELEILSLIKNIPLNTYDEMVTDEIEIYQLLINEFSKTQKTKIRLYQDNMISLSKLYSLETHLQEALGKKVWLRSGGYLVIEPTEAMVVIDVNTGKASSKASSKANGKDHDYLKVNLEAAQEVARQLRIRNYSGMIMVDFINMESKEDNQTLLDALDACLREDKVKTRLVDMTALGIVEITRKKTRKPLADFFQRDESAQI